MPVSILILTRNEEINIAGCLSALKGFDDVVVLDSLSTDQTPQIAGALGARVISRKFDNWAAHQNWAMEQIPFKHPWVFYLDADERMTPELEAEVKKIATDPGEKRVAFYCGRKNFFMDRWIRHAMPPGTIMRFFKPPFIRFERLVNPTPVIRGPHGYLRHMFEHYNFSKGLREWFEKHNNYSQFEALEGIKIIKGEVEQKPRVFTRDPAERRKALKYISFRLPARPAIKFFYFYFLKLGFLDGRAGLTYCFLQAMYEYMIVIKIRELRNHWGDETLNQTQRQLEASAEKLNGKGVVSAPAAGEAAPAASTAGERAPVGASASPARDAAGKGAAGG